MHKHRRDSLSAEQDELPAVSLDYGEDVPASVQVISEWRSVLTLEVTGIVKAATVDDLHDKLFELRADIHIAMREANGLVFVIDTLYGPVEAAEVSGSGSQRSAKLTTTWLVHYGMELNDPN